MSTPHVIDPAAIEALKSINPDDGGEFVREILQIFLEDTPARMAELNEALNSGNAAKFVRAAHSIKGSSSNIGAMVLKDTAEQLEHKARDEGLAQVALLLEQLRSDYELTAARIGEMV